MPLDCRPRTAPSETNKITLIKCHFENLVYDKTQCSTL